MLDYCSHEQGQSHLSLISCRRHDLGACHAGAWPPPTRDGLHQPSIGWRVEQLGYGRLCLSRPSRLWVGHYHVRPVRCRIYRRSGGHREDRTEERQGFPDCLSAGLHHVCWRTFDGGNVSFSLTACSSEITLLRAQIFTQHFAAFICFMASAIECLNKPGDQKARNSNHCLRVCAGLWRHTCCQRSS